MKHPIFLAAVLGLLAAPGQAQTLSGAERVESLPYELGKRHNLRITAGGEVTVVLSADEITEEVSLSDTKAFRVVVSTKGDHVTVRALRPAADTTMIVKTNQRVHLFLIQVGPYDETKYAVRFSYLPSPQSLLVPSSPNPSSIPTASTYKLRGTKALRPRSVREDGAKTYIEWADDQALPATFSLNSAGEEETVDSYMRGGIQTIDRVYDHLVFRLGKASASAERIVPKKRGR